MSELRGDCCVNKVRSDVKSRLRRVSEVVRDRINDLRSPNSRFFVCNNSHNVLPNRLLGDLGNNGHTENKVKIFGESTFYRDGEVKILGTNTSNS